MILSEKMFGIFGIFVSNRRIKEHSMRFVMQLQRTVNSEWRTVKIFKHARCSKTEANLVRQCKLKPIMAGDFGINLEMNYLFHDNDFTRRYGKW